MEGLSLIDVSSEDDLLFFLSTSDGPIDPTSSTESPEHKQFKSANFNLRKSLAWDNAFFTSEGVLDPEELAVVNSTFRKVEASALPVIPEDTRKSVESTSTLDNDSWDLENIQVDLFENVRASIQRSLGNAGKASKIALAGTKAAPLNLDVPLVESTEKIEPYSNNKKKPNLASERTSSHQRSQIANRDSQSISKIGTQGSALLKTALRPQRILSLASLPTMPKKESKMTASGSTQIAKNNAKAVPGDAGSQKTVKATITSNGVPSSRNTRSFLPRTSSTLSGSSQNLLNKSSDSESNSKLPVTKKISASKNVVLSGSTSSKIPVKATRTSSISKTASSPNILPSSTLNLYSAVSPSSSFDSLASEASSSASNTSKLAPSCSDAGSSSSSTSLPGSNKYLANSASIHRHARNGNLPLGNHLQSETLSKPSQEESVALEKARGNHIRVYTNNTSGGKCFKPSALRMPTPKIGYFDSEKNKIANVEKLPRYSQQNNIVKVPNRVVSGATKSTTTSKPESDKLPISASSSNNTVASDSPAIETDLVSACSVKSTLAEELSESAKSHSSSGLTETHRELTPNIVKDSSSTKEINSESKSSQYTEASGDKEESDSLTNTIDKENVSPVENSLPQQNIS